MASSSFATSGLLALGLWAARALPLAILFAATVVYAWLVIASAPAGNEHDEGPEQSDFVCVDSRSADQRAALAKGRAANDPLVVVANGQRERPTVFVVETTEDEAAWQARIDAANLLATAKGEVTEDHRIALLVPSSSEPAFRDGIHLENQVRLEQDLPLLRMIDLRP